MRRADRNISLRSRLHRNSIRDHPQMNTPKFVGHPGYVAPCRVRLARPGVIAIQEGSYGQSQIGNPRSVKNRPG